MAMFKTSEVVQETVCLLSAPLKRGGAYLCAIGSNVGGLNFNLPLLKKKKKKKKKKNRHILEGTSFTFHCHLTFCEK